MGWYPSVPTLESILDSYLTMERLVQGVLNVR